jgi:hypothetical protein
LDTRVGTSKMGQFRTHAPQQRSLVDYLVGAGEQRRRKLEALRLRGPEIDHQLACNNCPTVELPRATMTSGASAANSAESNIFGIASAPAKLDAQVPAIDQPDCCSPCWNAASPKLTDIG